MTSQTVFSSFSWAYASVWYGCSHRVFNECCSMIISLPTFFLYPWLKQHFKKMLIVENSGNVENYKGERKMYITITITLCVCMCILFFLFIYRVLFFSNYLASCSIYYLVTCFLKILLLFFTLPLHPFFCTCFFKVNVSLHFSFPLISLWYHSCYVIFLSCPFSN